MIQEELSYDKGLQVRLHFEGFKYPVIVPAPDQIWDADWGRQKRSGWLTQNYPGWTQVTAVKPVFKERSCMIIFAGWKVDLFTAETGALGMTAEKCEDEHRILEDDNVSVDIFVHENKDKSLSVTTA